MRYKLIRYARRTSETMEDAIKNFEEIINQFISEGWQVSGGVSVENGVFYQAIIKKK